MSYVARAVESESESVEAGGGLQRGRAQREKGQTTCVDHRFWHAAYNVLRERSFATHSSSNTRYLRASAWLMVYGTIEIGSALLLSANRFRSAAKRLKKLMLQLYGNKCSAFCNRLIRP